MATALEEGEDFEASEGTPSAPEFRPLDDPTGELYPEFQQAYQFFNHRLFEGQLPYVLITLQRKHSSEAYWSADRFSAVNGKLTGELAMNPRYLAVRSSVEILSVLVHEQVHVWQTYFGKPGRRGYHNRQWADKMKEIGLYPSSTDAVGGDETGEAVGHYIIDGGRFEIAAKELINSGFEFTWYDRFPAHAVNRIGRSSDIAVGAVPETASQVQESAPSGPESLRHGQNEMDSVQANSGGASTNEETAQPTPRQVTVSSLLQRPNPPNTPATLYPALQIHLPMESESPSRNRTRFECPQCHQRAWGKKSLAITCTPCNVPMGGDEPAGVEV